MRSLVLLLALTIGFGGYAQESVFEEREFASVEQERRFQRLTNELRCLVCQNQSIADSNAGLAAQLRSEVHEMLIEGSSDADIIDFMVARYGDFVLFKPPMKSTTAFLWLGPFVFLGAGLFFLFRQIKKRRQTMAETPDESLDHQALEQLLDDAPNTGGD